MGSQKVHRLGHQWKAQVIERAAQQHLKNDQCQEQPDHAPKRPLAMGRSNHPPNQPGHQGQD
ncbi:MAG: hypothetical protein RIR28_583, partial [Pseudomonadota bacterium]